MSISATEYPFDTQNLQKGDYIAPEIIEAALGKRRQTNAYQLELLKIKGDLEKRLAHRLDCPTIRIYHDGLRILTDPEAAEFNHGDFCGALRKMRRALYRQQAVDVRHLTGPQTAQHTEWLTRNAFIAGAVSRARRQVLPEPNQRTVPGLTSGE